ncbi:MAG: hypothetical protein PWQ43_868 [Rikenellaceae bacterium]|nr:hypothetical protein [Rikenellaceae bacterium]MDN5355926.1 hypothetical protein [Rikenellaceae bacterium]
MMNENILVSIIIPVYNGEKYLADTIQSVIDQTYKNWELIIVDDGSTDNTSNVVKQFNDSRISYIKKNNTGVSDTRNLGAMISNGEILCFLDADDIWLPENLEKKVEKLINEPQGVLVFSSMYLWDERGDYKTCKTTKKFLEDDWEKFRRLIAPTIPSSAIIKRDYFFEAGMFDTNISTSADFDLNIRLRELGEFIYIEEPLVLYRCHPSQMHNNIALYKHDMSYILEKYKSNTNLFPTKHDWRNSFSLLNYFIAVEFIKQKKFNKGFMHLINSFFYNPLLIFTKIYKKMIK